MPLNAGQLDRRLRIEQRAAGVDALGQASDTWQTLATVWAQYLPEKGREFFSGGQMQGATACAWRIRLRTDVVPAMRAVDLTSGGLTWDIESVVQNAGHEWLDLFCLSGTGDAR